MRKVIMAAAAVAALSAGTAAEAVQYIFTLTGAYSSLFSIGKSNRPTSFTEMTSTFDGVNGQFGGTYGAASITFSMASDTPVLQINNGTGNLIFTGAPVVVDAGTRPRFAEGIYSLNSSLGAVQLYIREAAGVPAGQPQPGGGEGSQVPEPATWALMIGGFAMTGVLQRRRARRRVVTG